MEDHEVNVGDVWIIRGTGEYKDDMEATVIKSDAGHLFFQFENKVDRSQQWDTISVHWVNLRSNRVWTGELKGEPQTKPKEYKAVMGMPTARVRRQASLNMTASGMDWLAPNKESGMDGFELVWYKSASIEQALAQIASAANNQGIAPMPNGALAWVLDERDNVVLTIAMTGTNNE